MSLPSTRRRRTPFVELDPIRHLISPGMLAWSHLRAAATGVGADQALIAGGVIGEEDYLRAFSRATGIPFVALDELPRAACPISDVRLLDLAATGIVPLASTDGLSLVVAPKGTAARWLAAVAATRPAIAHRLRVTSTARLHWFVAKHADTALGEHAAEALHKASPMLSAAKAPLRHPRRAAVFAAAAIAFAITQPSAALAAIDVGLCTLFSAWIGLRLLGPCMHRPVRAPMPITDAELPVYTVIAAVYREAASIGQLITAIRGLDWPPEKLDVKLVVEPDDFETRAAIAKLNLDPQFEVIVAPAAGPRTKPKALNAALPFARGTFTVIYDAEDCPEPEQLRAALNAFLSDTPQLACVQAALTIDNTADSLLTRLFTAEYAAQFDVFLPMLARLRAPLPLGGSSNHFRTQALRAVGAWDPYNVTEDADLGIRLSRYGYRSSVISSTTYEEAPAKVRPWVHQRTRWFKGWMQTWAVHTRAPLLALQDLGIVGFSAFQLIIAGNVLTALIYPVFLAWVGWQAIIMGEPMLNLLADKHMLLFAGGVLASVVTGVAGLARRKLLAMAWVSALAPIHWLLLSFAAWRALLQFVIAPYHWEKTAHGLAKTSRRLQRSWKDRRRNC